MKRLAILMATATVLLAGAAPAGAQQFDLQNLGVAWTAEEGPPTQAGSHPVTMTTTLDVNRTVDPELGEVPVGAVKNLVIDLPVGLAGDPRATPRCSGAEFADIEVTKSLPSCADSTAVGIGVVEVGLEGPLEWTVPIYNLTPPPGVAAKLGFVVLNVPVTVDLRVRESAPHNVVASLTNVSQAVRFYGSLVEIWGNPASPAHDPDRGRCARVEAGSCSAGAPERPFLTLPRSCGPLATTFRAGSWQDDFVSETVQTPPGAIGCSKLGFSPGISSQPTAENASSPTGLDFELQIDDQGLTSPTGIAHSDIKKAKVTLPKGVTINPSQAEGLEVCSEIDLARESADSEFGEGCPGASKIGSVEVETPLLEGEVLKGQLFVAEPYDNPFDSLLAIYMTIKSPKLGISIGLAGKVEPDRDSGQIITTFGGAGTDPLPQLPFSDFRLRFHEGGRSPLITPPGCGTFETEALFTPWANPHLPYPTTATFQITRGVGGGDCPSGGKPPFEPGFAAGTLSNAAGSHSPFLLRLTRRDGDQDITRFDAVLPKGVAARLVGVAWCPDAAIARAKRRDGKGELDDPSCPAASKIGSVQAGAGVGSQLTYVPGSVYLAGPFGGAPLSVVGVVPAVAGPFDVGTVVTRQALTLDPRTGEVEVDGALSDPIPHILAGIPLKVRDIRVSVNRPNFTLNPTSCNPMATLAGIWGGGSHPFSAADDLPALRQARFQAAGCAALGFEPRLAIRLKGGVKRGAHPALRAVVTPRPGQANFSRAVVTLPRSAFLEQAHIRTICTRVQFHAPPGHGAHCPPGARYGFARAWSPLLDAPAQGPVYLRSSDNQLPDLVVALKGPASAPVDVELSSRIDSVRGGIRSTFTGIPDLPVSRFILAMQGGKKGLIVNSRHLCHKPKRNRAKANLRGQNGRLSRTKPRVVAVKCAKRRKAKRNRAKRSAGHVARGSAVR